MNENLTPDEREPLDASNETNKNVAEEQKASSSRVSK